MNIAAPMRHSPQSHRELILCQKWLSNEKDARTDASEQSGLGRHNSSRRNMADTGHRTQALLSRDRFPRQSPFSSQQRRNHTSSLFRPFCHEKTKD